ncbi:MAG TPA: hypothetical protein VJN44_10270 [Roseateles sp.]|nr:hypothetical protein [Roseateles sp.]
MIDKAQIELAKALWEQSKAAAQQAHEAWGLVMKSQKTLMDSMRGSGMPFSIAADQFEKLMQFHAEQHQAALDYVEKMSAEYGRLLDKQKK